MCIYSFVLFFQQQFPDDVTSSSGFWKDLEATLQTQNETFTAIHALCKMPVL